MTKLSFLVLLSTFALAAGAKSARPAAKADANVSPEAAAVYQEVQKSMGIVPKFIRQFPQEGIVGAWDELKSVQMNPETAISCKYKELIGLAVSAQIPCRHCIYFHTEAAKFNGATDREVREALGVASIVRHWSTILNGAQMEETQFRKEVAWMLEFTKNGKLDSPPEEKEPISDKVAETVKDAKKTVGFFPTMLRVFPEEGVAGAWRELKNLEMNPQTALPGKFKELIGLAVAAQIPCRYCTTFHTEFAKANGATDREVREAVAMSAITRHWSTFLNGAQIDEKDLHREVTQIFNHLRKQGGERKAENEPGVRTTSAESQQ